MKTESIIKTVRPEELTTSVPTLSVFRDSVRATRNELSGLIGEPYLNNGDPESDVQTEWCVAREYDDPDIEGGKSLEFLGFISDWKEYRNYGHDTEIEWRISSDTYVHSRTIMDWINTNR